MGWFLVKQYIFCPCTSFFRLTNKPLHVHTNKAGISFLCINQSICHATKLSQADDLDSFTIYTHVNFDFLQMHILHDCPQQLSMRALMVVESQVYTDHNVDMHQSDSCMFDSAAQNLVSKKTLSYLCHTIGCINANTTTNPVILWQDHRQSCSKVLTICEHTVESGSHSSCHWH